MTPADPQSAVSRIASCLPPRIAALLTVDITASPGSVAALAVFASRDPKRLTPEPAAMPLTNLGAFVLEACGDQSRQRRYE